MHALRTIYRYWMALIFLAVVAQIAGAASVASTRRRSSRTRRGPDEQRMISEKVFDHGFGFHTAFGYLIFLAALVLLLLALAARLGKSRILWSLAVALLVALQIVLAWISESVHGVGILHGITALVILGLTGFLAREAWWGTRMPASTATPAT